MTTAAIRLVRPVVRPGLGWGVLAAALALVWVGLSAMPFTPSGQNTGIVQKQSVFLCIGLFAMLLTAMPHYRTLGQGSYVLAGVTVLLLTVLLVPGLPQSVAPRINGARRWFDLKVLLFQPSELAKIAYILAMAQYLHARQSHRTLKGLLVPIGLTGIPILLILLEPDLGTAMIFVPLLLAMLVAGGARLRHLLILSGLGASLLGCVLFAELALFPNQTLILKPHQKARIMDVAARISGDTRHSQGISFQGSTATRLVGAGGVTGNPPDHTANLIRHNHLPEAHNDMIFSVICNRWGLMGGLGVLGLYLVLIGSSLAIAAMNHDPFARLVVVGVVTVIFTQVFVNVGMNVGLLPITGMTLPLVSYGGSSLVITFVMVGLILSVAGRKPPAGAHRGMGQS